jgi:hypothetical protein
MQQAVAAAALYVLCVERPSSDLDVVASWYASLLPGELFRPQSPSFRFLKRSNIHHHPIITSNAIDIAVQEAFLNNYKNPQKKIFLFENVPL